MAHGRLISRLTLSVNTMLTWMWITRGDGHVSPGLGGYAILRCNVGEADAVSVAHVDDVAAGQSKACRSGCRSGRKTLRLADRGTSGSAETTHRGRHRKAGADRGVHTSLLRGGRGITDSSSTSSSIDEAERIAVANGKRRRRIGRSNAANQGGNSDKQQFLHSSYFSGGGMPHCLKPGKGRDPARRETYIDGLFAIVLDCGDSRETWINMLLFGSHLPGFGICPLPTLLPWLIIVVAEMLSARGALD